MPITAPAIDVSISGMISRIDASRSSALSILPSSLLKNPETTTARKKVPSPSCAAASAISAALPCSRIAGL